MTDELALEALRAAFGDDDAASLGWAQTAPDIKARCVSYVGAAKDDRGRQARAREVYELARHGRIAEADTIRGWLPEHLPGAALGIGGHELGGATTVP